MYQPFAEALNYALERVSNIQVNGLPEFKSHIAFVPCNKGLQSNRHLAGSRFKPDLAVMSLQNARELHKLERLDRPRVSEFLSEVAEKPPPNFGWEAILSAVELKRKPQMSGWSPLPEVFDYQDGQVGVTQYTDQRLDEKPYASKHTTRKIQRADMGVYTKTSCTAISSATLVSSKRSAGAAGMEASADTLGSKRQRGQKAAFKTATKALAFQDGVYTTEKFSDSFSISHVLNLLVESENQPPRHGPTG